jgi:hypothetical protein
MDRASLIGFAKRADFMPVYDPPTDEAQELVGDLTRAGYKPRLSMPGNDQHSHAIEIETKDRFLKIYVRFDLRIVSVIAYQKIGSSRSFSLIDFESEPTVSTMFKTVAERGLEYISHEDAQIDLGSRPLEQGHMSSALFAYLFEDA